MFGQFIAIPVLGATDGLRRNAFPGLQIADFEPEIAIKVIATAGVNAVPGGAQIAFGAVAVVDADVKNTHV